jgi:hypothetical protein
LQAVKADAVIVSKIEKKDRYLPMDSEGEALEVATGD